ncbi:MAG: helix-turn-helix domain-containing protein [Clostridiales bacterium]|nr:helix-turn-helix domain-containing protein [Clostridiales bacterium]
MFKSKSFNVYIHKKTFIDFFLKYMAVVVVLSLPLFSLYKTTLDSVRDSVVNESFSAVQKGYALLEKEVSNQHATAVYLRRNDDYIKLARIQGPVPLDKVYTVLKAKKLFSNTGFPSNIIFDNYFSFRNSGLLLTRDMIFVDMEDAYQTFLKTDSMDYGEWEEMLYGNKHQVAFKKSFKFLHRASIHVELSEIEVIPLVLSLPLEGSLHNDSAMLVLFNANELVKAFSTEAILTGGFLHVVASTGEILYSHNPNGIGIPDIASIPVGISQTQWGGEDTTFLRNTPSQIGLSIVAGIPDSVFSDQISEVMRSLLIVIALFILLGLVIALAFSYSNSRPVSELIKTVNDIGSFSTKADTFALIRDSIIQIDTKGKQNESQLRTLKEAIMLSLTEKILNGRLCDKNDKESFLAYYEITEPCFLVACMIPQDGSSTEERALFSMALEDALRSHSHACVTHHIGTEAIALILNITSEEAQDESLLLAEIRTLLQELKASGVDAVFGLSRPCQRLDDIHRCFNQAKEAASLADNSGIVMYSGPELNSIAIFDLSSAQLLTDLLLLGDSERISAFFSLQWEKASKAGPLSGVEKSQIALSIRNTLCCAAASRKWPIELPAYSDSQPLQESLEELKESALQIAEIQKSIQLSKSSKLKNGMLAHVAENYKDPLICAASVADAFGVSEKQVFNLFRAETGKSFGEYLESLRLKETERLLLNPSIVINSIHGQVGFNSSNTFYKVFKRVYNTSPGVWRQAHLAERPEG